MARDVICIAAFFLVQFMCLSLRSSAELIRETLEQDNCNYISKKIFKVGAETTVIITGKKRDVTGACSMKFALDTQKEPARLRLNIDTLYIHDCGVELHIFESPDISFPANSTQNQQMLKSKCNTKSPAVLHAQPGNFVLVKLIKQEDNKLGAYNFRINITMMAGSLPLEGPAFHAVLLTGLVTTVAVVVAVSMLCRYLAYVTTSWPEPCEGSTLRDGLHLHNSQERISEQVSNRNPHSGGRRSVEERVHLLPGSHSSASASEPARSAAASDREHSQGSDGQAGCEQRGQSSSMQGQPDTAANLDDTSSVCELPPSYEEALGLPLPVSERQEDSSIQACVASPSGDPGLLMAAAAYPTDNAAINEVNPKKDMQTSSSREDRSKNLVDPLGLVPFAPGSSSTKTYSDKETRGEEAHYMNICLTSEAGASVERPHVRPAPTSSNGEPCVSNVSNNDSAMNLKGDDAGS